MYDVLDVVLYIYIYISTHNVILIGVHSENYSRDFIKNRFYFAGTDM